MRSWRWSALLPLAVSVAILMVLGPEVLLSPTTPTGGDLGIHVYPFHQAVSRVLSGHSPMGWDPGWFTGFPLFYFYFPLPAGLMALLTPLAGFEVALKLVAVSGVVCTPLASFFLARWMGLGPLESGFAGALGGAFVFMESYWLLGGNIESTVMGEFAYSISFVLSLAFIGLVARFLARIGSGAGRGGTAVEDQDRATAGASIGGDDLTVFPAGAVAGFVLAATALSHLLPTVAAVVASVPLLLKSPARRFVLVAWSVGFALSGFWSVPFLLRSSWMGHVPWNPGSGFQTLMPAELWFLIPGAALGLIVVRRLGWPAVPFLTVVAFGATLFVLPFGLEMRDRFLPYWYFGLHFLVGVALGRSLGNLLGRRSASDAVVFPALAILVGALFVLRDVSSVRDFARWNLEGFEVKEAWPRFGAFMDSLETLPAGRVAWQSDSVLARLGAVGAPALAPYWSPSHPALLGLHLESTPTAPFARRVIDELSPRAPHNAIRGSGPPEPFDLDRGVRHLGVFGVRYFATFTAPGGLAARSSPRLRPVVGTDGFGIFEVAEHALVSPATRMPTVALGDFSAAAERWFDRDRRYDEWLAEDGPPSWPRRSGDPASWPVAPALEGAPGKVTDVEESDGRVSFTTEAVGVPHLVRISMFPNWVAEGADGPWRAAPSLMVVVPRQERVTLRFRTTWVEWAGWLTTAGGLLALVFVALRRRRLPDA